MFDEDSDGGSEGQPYEKLSKLKQNEQRMRVFVTGNEEDISALIKNVEKQKWYKGSQVNGKAAQINCKYPVLGSKIYGQVPSNILSNVNLKNRKNKNTSKTKQSQSLEFLTCSKTYYTLQQLKLALYNQEDEESESHKKVHLSRSQSPQPSNNDSRVEISRDNASNYSSLQTSQLLQMQVENNNAQRETLNQLIETSKEWMKFMKETSELQQKQQRETNEMMKTLLNSVTKILQVTNNTSSQGSQNSVQYLKETEEANQTNKQQQQQQPQKIDSLDSNTNVSFQTVQTVQQQIKKQKGLVVKSEEIPVVKVNYDEKKNEQLENINNIFTRINQLIADEGVFEYDNFRKQLLQELFEDQYILATFAKKRTEIDNLIEIFQSAKKMSQFSSSYQRLQNPQQYPQQYFTSQISQSQQLLPPKQTQTEAGGPQGDDNSIININDTINNTEQYQHLSQLDQNENTSKAYPSTIINQSEEQLQSNFNIQKNKLFDNIKIESDRPIESLESSLATIQQSNLPQQSQFSKQVPAQQQPSLEQQQLQ